MSFKETCKKVRNAIAEDLKKKGPYDITDAEFKDAWKDVGKFFADGAKKVMKVFGCGSKANDYAATIAKVADKAKNR